MLKPKKLTLPTTATGDISVLRAALGDVVSAVRTQQPLVHCLTATVSMSLVADGLLATGARPMMTETEAEAPQMDAMADALLINLGTLSNDGAAGIPPTVAAARDRGIPWVLDPAAVGVAPVRTALAHKLAQLNPSVIRANASEVTALSGGHGGNGPDATRSSREVAPLAESLAAKINGVVAMSGDPDVISSNYSHASVDTADYRPITLTVTNGVKMLTNVTGSGCLLGGIVAACCAVAEPFLAAVTATVWLGLAGERAAATVSGPGSMKIAMIDQLYLISPAQIAEAARLAYA